MFIGEIIKEYRTIHNITLRDFAARTSLSHSYISTLEQVYNPKTNKPYSVTTDAAKEIAEAMKMPIEELIRKLDETQEFEINGHSPMNRTRSIPVAIYRYPSNK